MKDGVKDSVIKIEIGIWLVQKVPPYDLVIPFYRAFTKTLKMSSSTFSFAKGLYSFDWDVNPQLNDPKYESPIPCKAGYNCCYDGVCSFVHPGEEGVGRRMFPARSAEEKTVVRLFGLPERKATFYERRRLRLSWPQWCQKMGWSLPVAEAKASTKVKANTSNLVPKAANHKRREIINLTDSSVASKVEQPVVTYVAYVQPTEEQMKQYYGDMLYQWVQYRLSDPTVIEALKEAKIWSQKQTPEKITGMFLDAMNSFELQEMMNSESEFNDALLNACTVLSN